MEGRFVGNHGKQAQLDVVKKISVPEVGPSSVTAWKQTPGGHVEYIPQLSGGHNSETRLQYAYVHVMLILVL